MEQSSVLLQNLSENFLNFLPKFLMGIGFVIGAYIAYKMVLWVVKRFLKLSKIDRLNKIINENELISGNNLKIDISQVLLGIVKFITILVILIVGAEFLKLRIVSEQIGKLLEYFPQLITGALIFLFGAYLASQAKKLIYNLVKSLDSGGAKAISSLAFYLIFIFTALTALNQIGVETDMISNNISYFIGAALIAVTIAIGLGSRDIVYRLILGFYTKKNLEIGMKIQIGDQIGTIESIDNICLVLKTDQEKIIFPIKRVNNSEVKILT